MVFYASWFFQDKVMHTVSRQFLILAFGFGLGAICSLQTADARKGKFLSMLINPTTGQAAARQLARPRHAKNYTADVLTPSELESCIIDARFLDERYTSLSARASAINTLSQELEQQKNKIESSRFLTPLLDSNAVNQFNMRVDSFNKQIIAYQHEVKSYRHDESSFKVKSESCWIILPEPHPLKTAF